MKIPCLLSLLVFAPVTFAGPTEIPSCPRKLAPVTALPPKFPALLHNEYFGKAEIAFIVTPSGGVEKITIVSLQLHPVGHTGNKPQGYREALLSAVNQWRYAPRPNACRQQLTIAVKHVADGT